MTSHALIKLSLQMMDSLSGPSTPTIRIVMKKIVTLTYCILYNLKFFSVKLKHLRQSDFSLTTNFIIIFSRFHKSFKRCLYEDNNFNGKIFEATQKSTKNFTLKNFRLHKILV